MRYLAIGLAALALVACSGGDPGDSERVLVLGSGDFSEEEFRAQVRVALLEPGSAETCDSLEGLSANEVVDTLNRAIQTSNPTTPVQTAIPGDRERAGEIFMEECDRLTSE